MNTIPLIFEMMFSNHDSGLKEYMGANPTVQHKYAASFHRSRLSDIPISCTEFEDEDVHDEFYDAIAADSSSDEESDDNEDHDQKVSLPLLNYSRN